MSHIIAGNLSAGGAGNLAHNLNHLNPKCRATATQLYPDLTWSVSADILAEGVCAAIFNELGHHAVDHGRKVKANESCAKMQKCNGTGKVQGMPLGRVMSTFKLIACPGCDECPDDEEEDGEDEEDG